eukprot:TRINITY_DN7153_c0_g1_i1.p1 TRINITY_DN7153_c0_g1~~TRINITY_DN7153_c0_g1_i1.p1  ORF type:complete len:236 (+),score=19.57 TRINITY_DN7153_c0_g1_i1:19-726(+)
MTCRVLFMHGLESGPTGTKARRLREYYDVVAPAMDTRSPRSVQKSRPLQGFVAGGLGGVAGIVFSATFLPVVAVVGCSAGILAGLGIAFQRVVQPKVVAEMIQLSVETQRRAIEESKPDIVVASSWGGAVAVECIRRGYWKGPTLLLAPAQDAVAKRMREPLPDLAGVGPMPLTIVHGEQDDTIALEHSQRLVESLASWGEAVRLHVVQDGHRLDAVCTADRFKELIEELRTRRL